MFVDSTVLMCSAVQCCRHALRRTPTALSLLAETLEMVKQQGDLIVEVTEDWVKKNDLQSLVITTDAEPKRDGSLSAANQKLFSLLETGAHELQTLWAAEAKGAVRSLGYAFHVIPTLLWTPEQFSRRGYLFCFRIICKHWDELSPEMRQAFSEIQGVELTEAERLAHSAEFPINMFGSSA